MRFETINAFQPWLFACLTAEGALRDEIGTAVYDAKPIAGSVPEIYLQIGDGFWKEKSAQDLCGRTYFFDVHLYAQATAFSRMQMISSLIQDLILNAEHDSIDMRGIWLEKIQNYRLDQGALKRMSHRFLARFDIT